MKAELTIAGAACAVYGAPLIVGVVVAAPAVAAVDGVAAVAAGGGAFALSAPIYQAAAMGCARRTA